MFNLRYSRETALKEISIEGYERIRKSKICVVGLGATGSPVADLFVRAGVGKITLIDGDTVDISNLHRQVLYSEEDIGEKKVKAAGRRLKSINSKCDIGTIDTFLDAGNADALLGGADIVIDGTDNMETRKVINRYCVRARKPWIFISSIGTVAQVKAVIPGVTSCLECFLDPQSSYSMSCEETGVLASAPVIASSLAWTRAVRIILGLTDEGNLEHIDPWNSIDEQIHINRNPQCSVCSSI